MHRIKNLSVAALNAILIFAVVAIFLAVLFICYRSLVQIDTDEYWVVHSYQVQGNLDDALADQVQSRGPAASHFRFQRLQLF